MRSPWTGLPAPNKTGPRAEMQESMREMQEMREKDGFTPEFVRLSIEMASIVNAVGVQCGPEAYERFAARGRLIGTDVTAEAVADLRRDALAAGVTVEALGLAFEVAERRLMPVADLIMQIQRATDKEFERHHGADKVH